MLQKFELPLSLDSHQLGLQVTVKQGSRVNNGAKSPTNSASKKANGVNEKIHAKSFGLEEKLLQDIASGKWKTVFDSNADEMQKFTKANAHLVETAKLVLCDQWIPKSAQFAYAFVSWNRSLNQQKFEPSKACGEFVSNQSDADKIKVIEFLINLVIIFKEHFVESSQQNMLALIGFIADRTSLENSDENKRVLFESCIHTVSELLAEAQLRTSIRSSLEMLQKSQINNRKLLRYEPIEF